MVGNPEVIQKQACGRATYYFLEADLWPAGMSGPNTDP